LRGKRLLEKVHRRIEAALPGSRRVIQVPGHVQRAERGALRAEALDELGSAQSRQHQVRQDEVDVASKNVACFDGSSTIAGGQYAVPVLVQHLVHDATGLIVVLDEENRFVTTGDLRRRLARSVALAIPRDARLPAQKRRPDPPRKT
jgi:hypothetical protein